MATLIVATSLSIALRDRGFRRPDSVVVSTPQVIDPAAAGSTAELRTSKTAEPTGIESGADDGSASIVRVEPKSETSDNVIIIRDPSQIGSNPRLAHIPDRRLIEQSEHGRLPKRAEDGRRPFDAYARAWSGARGARVAILIGGLGLSQTGTQKAISALPPTVTLAFAPQGNSIDRWMQSARREGHEIMLQVPLEPFGYPQIDPGRNTLIVDESAEENLDRLRWALGRTTNYTGIVNYMGGRFISDKSAMELLMRELSARGLAFLDDGSAARSIADELALRNGVPFAAGDMAIDGEQTRGAILKKLDELERTARAKGTALGTGSAFDVTVDAVADWIREAKRRGIEIVPVSALARDPERR